MLELEIDESELWDERRQEFILIPKETLKLEHSLISLSKWESKWKKPLLSNIEKFTMDEYLDYIKCMTINQNVNPFVYNGLTKEHFAKIAEYMTDSMTATTFNDRDKKPNRSITTAEILYYEMTALNIPFECEKWHLNRLLTLIRVCAIKNAPPKKRNKNDIARERYALNRQRRAASGSSG